MNHLIKRRVLIQGAVACSFGLGLHAQAQQLLDTIVKRGSLRIGVPVDVPPFGALDADKNPIGLDIDVAEFVAKSMGLKAELVPVASGDRLPWLQQRKVDLVVSTLGKTPEREKLIDFSDSYSNFHLVVFGARTLNVASISDLAGKTISVTKGSVEDGELTRNAPAQTQVLRMDSNAATLAAFVEKKVQLMASGISAGAGMMLKNPELNAEEKFILKENPIHVGLPKGESLLMEKVNAAIQAARSSGELRKIQRQWFSRAGLKT